MIENSRTLSQKALRRMERQKQNFDMDMTGYTKETEEKRVAEESTDNKNLKNETIIPTIENEPTHPAKEAIAEEEQRTMEITVSSPKKEAKRSVGRPKKYTDEDKSNYKHLSVLVHKDLIGALDFLASANKGMNRTEYINYLIEKDIKEDSNKKKLKYMEKYPTEYLANK